MSLPINYKEDIFTGNRKYRMIENGDGTVSFEDVTEYSQVGDTFGASQINEIDAEINDIGTDIETINSSITSINNKNNTQDSNITSLGNQLRSGGATGTNFYFDTKNGKYGWNSSSARGAGTFHPFKQAIPTPFYWNPTLQSDGDGGSASTTFTAPETGKYYIYGAVGSNVDDTHSTSVVARAALNGSNVMWAANSRTGSRSDGQPIWASSSGTVTLTAGQRLTLEITAHGFGVVQWYSGGMIVVVYSGE